MDLLELQADAHLAINHMLSIKRSSDLERQQVIWDFQASLHQRETKAAATNERAKIVHLRKDLQARVMCTKAVMRAKYNYRVAIQEASVVRQQTRRGRSHLFRGPQGDCCHEIPSLSNTLQGTCKVHE